MPIFSTPVGSLRRAGGVGQRILDLFIVYRPLFRFCDMFYLAYRFYSVDWRDLLWYAVPVSPSDDGDPRKHRMRCLLHRRRITVWINGIAIHFPPLL